jgi:hypothetical protein
MMMSAAFHPDSHFSSSLQFLAERVGFEPTVRFPVHSISSAASSATPAPLLKELEIKNAKGLKVALPF